MDGSEGRGRRRRVLGFGPVQLVLCVLALFVAVILRDVILSVARGALEIGETPKIWLAPGGVITSDPAPVGYAVLAAAVMIALGWLAYRIHVRLVERRPADELRARGALGALALGALLGAAVLGLVVGALAALGMLQVSGRTVTLAVLVPLASAATAAFMEELLFRGVLFRFLERWTGSWIALAVSAVLFGLGHAGNPNATWASTAAVALLAGPALGAAYMATRSLWLPIGMHFAVNALQGSVLGLPVSGKPTEGLLASQLTGPPLLTGGGFGLESSVLLLPLGAVVIIGFLWLARRRGRSWPRPGGGGRPDARCHVDLTSRPCHVDLTFRRENVT